VSSLSSRQVSCGALHEPADPWLDELGCRVAHPAPLATDGLVAFLAGFAAFCAGQSFESATPFTDSTFENHLLVPLGVSLGCFVLRAPRLERILLRNGMRLVVTVSMLAAVLAVTSCLAIDNLVSHILMSAILLLFPAVAVVASRIVRDVLTRSGRPAFTTAGLNGRARPQLLKEAMDMFLSALLLVLAAPLFAVIIAVSSLDGGPIFFAHRRLGADGLPFDCLKFRTMVVDADHVLEHALAQDALLAEEWRTSRKLSRDPRVTALGVFLRKTSLDELPQLINVLRRDMSLVGPRPIVQNEVLLYGEGIVQYYAARPGLTGLWQVSGRSSTSYARRVELDVWYVNNWTIWCDLGVLLKTIPVVLLRRGAC